MNRPVAVGPLILIGTLWCLAAPLAGLAQGVAESLSEPEDPIVATWNGGRLLHDDHRSWRQLHGVDPGPEAVREHVYLQSMAAAARQRGAGQEPETKIAVEATRQTILMKALRQHVIDEVSVSDEEVDEALRRTPDAFVRPRKLKLRSIYKSLGGEQPGATRRRMVELHRQLAAGADFAELAESESESQNRFRGGALGFVSPDQLPPAVAAAVEQLAPGGLTAPIEHSDGLSIFYCEQIRQAVRPSRDEQREKLRAGLLRERSRSAWTRYREELTSWATARGLGTLSQDELIILAQQRARDRTFDQLSPDEVEELRAEWRLGVAGVARAEQLGLHREPDVAATLRFRTEALLARREIVRHIESELEERAVSEPELRRYFAANSSRYRIPESYHLRILQFARPSGPTARKDLEDAVQVARQLERGELDFSEAARRWSIHRSAASGGDAGWQSVRQIGALGARARQTIDALEPGQSSQLLSLDSGLWIFQLLDHRDARPATFEQVEEQVLHDVQNQRIQSLSDRLRNRHLVEISLVIVTPQP